jgi:hypothetical protein
LSLLIQSLEPMALVVVAVVVVVAYGNGAAVVVVQLVVVVVVNVTRYALRLMLFVGTRSSW